MSTFDSTACSFLQFFDESDSEELHESIKIYAEHGQSKELYNLYAFQNWNVTLKNKLQSCADFNGKEFENKQIHVIIINSHTLTYLLDDTIIGTIQLHQWLHLQFHYMYHPIIVHFLEYLTHNLFTIIPYKALTLKKHELLMFINHMEVEDSLVEHKINKNQGPYNYFSDPEIICTGYWYYNGIYKFPAGCKKLIYSFVSWLPVGQVQNIVSKKYGDEFQNNSEDLYLFGRFLGRKINVYKIVMPKPKLSFVIYCFYGSYPFPITELGTVSPLLHLYCLILQFLESPYPNLNVFGLDTEVIGSYDALKNIIMNITRNVVNTLVAKPLTIINFKGLACSTGYYKTTRVSHVIKLHTHLEEYIPPKELQENVAVDLVSPETSADVPMLVISSSGFENIEYGSDVEDLWDEEAVKKMKTPPSKKLALDLLDLTTTIEYDG